MTRLVATITAAASAGGTTTPLLVPSTSYEKLTVQLTNLGAAAATAALFLTHNSTAYRVSPSAIALGAGGADVAEVTLPAINPGEQLSLVVTSADDTITAQALVWAKIASIARS